MGTREVFKTRTELVRWFVKYAQEHGNMDFYNGEYNSVDAETELVEALMTEWNITKEES